MTPTTPPQDQLRAAIRGRIVACLIHTNKYSRTATELLTATMLPLVEEAYRAGLKAWPGDIPFVPMKGASFVNGPSTAGGASDSEPRLLTPAMAARGTPRASVPTDLLEALLQPDPCDLDCNGDCQMHGYFGLEPGEQCPQARLRAILTRLSGAR